VGSPKYFIAKINPMLIQKNRLRFICTKRNIFLLTIFVLAVLLIIFLVFILPQLSGSKIPPEKVFKIIEPNAPLSNTFSLKPIDTKGVKDIKFVKYSEDQKKVATLTNSDSGKNYKLIVSDSNWENQKIIESEDALNVNFIDNSNIYYQKTGNDYGIFLYSFNDDKKNKFFSSVDPEMFNNVVMIGNNQFFYIQPKTGNYGFGNLSTGKLNNLGQKAIDQASIQDKAMSEISDPTISLDKNNLVILQLVPNSSPIQKDLLIFPIKDFDFSKPIFSTRIQTTQGARYQWIADQNLLVAGDDSTVIDILKKEIVFKGTKDYINYLSISPNTKLAGVCYNNYPTDRCSIINFNNSQEAQTMLLPNDTSKMVWLDNNNCILIVGKSLYDFNIVQKSLEKLSPNPANTEYSIITASLNNVMILKDGLLYQIN